MSKEHAEAEGVPYLFTYYLTKGGLRFVSKIVFGFAILAMNYFQEHTSAKQLLEIQSKQGSVQNIGDILATNFCSTNVCRNYIHENLPQCHNIQLAVKFTSFLFTSVSKRKLRLMNEARITKEISYAGKTALMRTNPLVENTGNHIIEGIFNNNLYSMISFHYRKVHLQKKACPFTGWSTGRKKKEENHALSKN